jgi:predicted dehydrogenase
MSSMRIAVVGCGYWGMNLIGNFAHVRDGGLVAFCAQDAARLKAAAQDHPAVARIREYNPLLEDSSLDAVAIATSAASHSRLTKKALLSGKHVSSRSRSGSGTLSSLQRTARVNIIL